MLNQILLNFTVTKVFNFIFDKNFVLVDYEYLTLSNLKYL